MFAKQLGHIVALPARRPRDPTENGNSEDHVTEQSHKQITSTS